ncbi:MAG: hypothetical protein JW940_38525 [Polyangiaceae bacterium]|nr:hypothetical protein [Polyangiaceae bacterium]
MRRVRTLFSAAACLALVAVATSVHAGPNEVATAEALFQQARQLMKEGRFSQACPKLAESQRLDPAVGTLLYLAECYEKNGQTASAWATFELAAAEGRKDNQAAREKIAKERAQQLVGRLSRLTIAVPAAARVVGLVVRRDDIEVGEPSWDTALPVDPGQHVVQASAPGKKPWVTAVDVGPDAASAQVEIPVLEDSAPDAPARAAQPQPVAPPSPPVVAAAPAPPPSKDSGSNPGGTQRIAGLAIGGAGVASLGVGTVLAIMAQSKETDSEKYCAPDDTSRCTQQGIDILEDARGLNTAGNILLGVGGLLVVSGAVLYLTAPRGSDAAAGPLAAQVAVASALSPTGGHLIVSGRF